MQVYLVGGAVRDHLLGHPYHEKDYVVVGASPNQMLNLGYQPVGKDFPVFLHPETKEERRFPWITNFTISASYKIHLQYPTKKITCK